MSQSLRAVAHLRAVLGAAAGRTRARGLTRATAGRAVAGRFARATVRATVRAAVLGGGGHVGRVSAAQGVARHRGHVGVVTVAVAHGERVLALALWIDCQTRPAHTSNRATYVVQAGREVGLVDGDGRGGGLSLSLGRGARQEVSHRLEVRLGEGHFLSERLSDGVLDSDSL